MEATGTACTARRAGEVPGVWWCSPEWGLGAKRNRFMTKFTSVGLSGFALGRGQFVGHSSCCPS